MEKLRVLGLSAIVGGLLACLLLDCTPGARRDVANAALDVAQVACIIANAESDEATVKTVCNIADQLAPDLRRLIGEQRAAARKYAASKVGCGTADGGAK